MEEKINRGILAESKISHNKRKKQNNHSKMYRLNHHSEEEEEENTFGLADEAIVFHGLEKCITGMDQFGYAVYDYLKMLDVFTGDGMTHEEAEEWIDFNVACVNAGRGFVIHYPNL